jgi:hypothetical protein
MGEDSTRAGGNGPTETGGGRAVPSLSLSAVHPPTNKTVRIKTAIKDMRIIWAVWDFNIEDAGMVLLPDKWINKVKSA